MNFFEEVAGQYNADMLSKPAARRELVPMAAYYWDLGGWFVDSARRRQPSALSQWEKMVAEFRVESFMEEYTRVP